MQAIAAYCFRIIFPGILLLLIAGILPVGCDGSGGISNQDRIVLSSAFDFTTATTRGYQFAEARYVEFPASDGSVPDIIIENFKKVDDLPQPGFTSPSNSNGFALVGEFGSLTASEDFYQSYDAFDTSLTLSPTTDTVRPYQVFVLRTVLDQYVKIHVRSISNIQDMSGEYVEVSIDYYHQDDGSASFP